MRYQLVLRNNIIPLRRDAIIGRSQACTVVLDGADVSRRHARLVISDAGVIVEDCTSGNGVLVNGEPVKQSRQLSAGDRFVIGAHILTLQAAEEPGERASKPTPYVQAPLDDLFDDDDDAFSWGDDTSLKSRTGLLGSAAEELLREGRLGTAEDIISPHLLELLDTAKRTGHTDAESLESAARYALGLAGAGARSKWVAYVFELYAASNTAVPAELEALANEARRSG